MTGTARLSGMASAGQPGAGPTDSAEAPLLTKVALTLAVIVMALIVVPRLLRPRRRPQAGPPARVEELIPCPRCGTYRGSHDPCECGIRPTSRH